jgi:hypothetical protein
MAIEVLNGNATEIDFPDPSVLTNGSPIDKLVFVASTIGTGGGGTIDRFVLIHSEHAAKHLPVGVAAKTVEEAITNSAQTVTRGAGAVVGEFWGKVVVEGREWLYLARGMGEQGIQVGTYYPRTGPR